MGSIPACAGEPSVGVCGDTGTEVYPRVCGGTTYDYTKATLADGLSPRVRGNLLYALKGATEQRSIPACAGEPRLPVPPDPLPRVYPRVCGGTSPRSPTFSPCSGLSPRVRGNRQRLINSSPGLSPRVRGNPPVPVLQEERSGSIPACAGEPPRMDAAPTPTPVYPRVCGGTGSFDPETTGQVGLSPRVRGNPWLIG